MNLLKFGVRKQEFKPLVSEKLGAYSLWIRVPLAALIGALLGECLFWIYEIAIIGINNTQISEEARAAEKAVVLIGMAFGVVASIFKGATARAKGFAFWHGMANLIIVVYAAIEILSVIKGRLSNQTLQDNARIAVQTQINALDEKIRTAKTTYDTATENAKPLPLVEAKKSGWLAIEASRKNQENREKSAKAAVEQKAAEKTLNELRDQRAAIKPPAPTETSILGADFAHWMRISGSALLILMSIVLSRFLGVIVESFGIHRAVKYVSQNTEAVEIKRDDPPVAKPDAPKAMSRPAVKTPKPTHPDAPKMGDVEVPSVVRGAALATLLGAGTPVPSLAANDGIMPATEAVAVQTHTGMGKKAPENEAVGVVGVGSGGSSGGSSGSVEVQTPTTPTNPSFSSGSVGVEESSKPPPKPHYTYADFLMMQEARESLKEAMKSGE